MITAEFIQGTRPKAAESLSKSDWGLRTEKESEPSHKTFDQCVDDASMSLAKSSRNEVILDFIELVP